MKKLLVILLSLGLGLGASAQKINRGAVRQLKPSTKVVRVIPVRPVRPHFGFGLGYGYRYSPFYNPFYIPFNAYYPAYDVMPSELELELEGIKNEYQHEISTTRRDKTISRSERREKIRELKHQREDALIDAKKSYYKENREDVSK